ncbi:ABC transporter ATP-binding protein/permease [Staphylococcus simiae]|uniref:ABC transporter ATP-binding protein n=1 Tax=Staphylococcus simiae CCM 7213 = CCUG 51256 TaxID=911238 RepID=G5JL52_9STAP|nr:ABC transporter ATP-binding protein/permease [Staphylococcus simiae]EHJ07070.1 ABC transporter ATP-binding protein [Staphylococcus simiae CCM 7213 = CCUG 51256]PNZ10034.1 cysteine ABC transporter ATP-binding protein [Staphylococcus simiae]SNV63828.1 Transport ATP-binding protein CydD [Staphylococcus simiae]
MKKLTALALKYKIYPILMFIMSVCLGIVVISQNILIADFLSAMLNHHYEGLMHILFIIVSVLILRAVIQHLNQHLGDRLAYKVKLLLRKQMISRHNKYLIGEQMALLTENIDGMGPFYRSYLPQVFKSMMVPFIIIVTMLFIHVNTAIIMIVTAPFIPLFYIIFGLKTRDDSKDQMTYLNQFSQRFLNVAKGLITLKLFNRTEQTEQNIYEDSTRFRDITMKILRSAFLSGLMLEFISMLGIGLVALEATLSLVVFKTIDFRTATIAIILAPEFYNAIKDLGQAFHTGKQSEGSSDVVFEYIDQQEQQTISQTTMNPQQQAIISLQNVNFAYELNQNVIKNINLEVFKGDHIAVVGPSGAGKTTLIQLLTGRLQPTNGRISFQHELAIGTLSQQPHIFRASIKDNITMFRQVDDQVVKQVLAEVGLLNKIQTLSHGINTIIGEGGEMLSGGQMRRIELCRLLISKPQLVIFDEPSTGLDIATEQIIQRLLFKYFKDITMIVIAHRDSTISNLSRRLYLEQGEIKADDDNVSVKFQSKEEH